MFVSVTAALVSTVSVSAVITRPVFWVTAPLMSLTPIATVPLAAVIVPRATVEASRIVTTVPVPVEVMLPRRLMAEPWASIVAVPLPALIVVAVACVTPTPVRAMEPTSSKQSCTRLVRRESVTLVEKLAISIPPSFRRPGGPSAARSSH